MKNKELICVQAWVRFLKKYILIIVSYYFNKSFN